MIRELLTQPRAPSRCLVLVRADRPVGPGMRRGLRSLDRRGYVARRMRADMGVSADDLAAGFGQLMWIDPDIVFDLKTLLGSPARDLRSFACCNRRLINRSFHASPCRASAVIVETIGLCEVQCCGLGHAHIRSALFDSDLECHKVTGCPRWRPPTVG